MYEKYNKKTYYVSISDADRAQSLDYIDTVYHGIDIEQFEFNDNPDDYLIFFGRIHYDKGTKEAIEIAKKTHRPLIIAGIIQDKEYYETYVKPEIDGKQIQYIGSVGPDKRNFYLKNAYALLHPINFNEPFGLSVVEAMACGTPVIAFPKGSMPEIIKPGLNGFLPKTIQ
jgi:glycosyltransferase involved in cell wall biosynthesis